MRPLIKSQSADTLLASRPLLARAEASAALSRHPGDPARDQPEQPQITASKWELSEVG